MATVALRLDISIMEPHISDHFLMTLVHCLRNACKKYVKFDDLVALSGYVCIDVDGTTQHRFLLNELITKTKNSEGQSFGLQAVDWSCLKKKVHSHNNSQKSIWRRNGKNWSIRTSHHYNPKAHPSFQEACLKRNNALQRGSGISVNHFQYPNARKKINSQTFTLKDFSACSLQKKPRGSPTGTFSNTTVSLTNKSFSAKVLNNKYPFAAVKSLPLEGNKNSAHKCNDSSCLSKCKSGTGSHHSEANAKNSVCEKAHGGVGNCATVIPTSCVQNELMKSTEALICSPSATHGSNLTLSPTFNGETALSSNSDSSDVSIGSTKPRYLVQNNDELLESFPNPDTTDDQFQVQDLSQSQICDDNSSVPSPAHISSVISTIINAISRSSSRTWHDAAVKPSYIFENVNQEEERDHVSLESDITLGTLSSMEGDLSACKSPSIETSKGQEVKKKLKRSPWRIKRTESHQMNQSSSNISKKKVNIFKWMRLFKKDSSHLAKSSETVSAKDSPVSMRSWPSIPDLVISEEISRENKHQQ